MISQERHCNDTRHEILKTYIDRGLVEGIAKIEIGRGPEGEGIAQATLANDVK